MIKTFYLMRHGETLFNVRRKIQGWCDSPLTENGIEQAEKTAAFFDDIPLDHLYSSTSERACDTAEIVTRHRMTYTRLKGLREMNFGVYEGESEDLHPSMEARATHYLQFGGESKQQVQARLVNTCTEIMNQPEHQCVLAVSHAGACKQFLSRWADAAHILSGRIPNCAIFKFTYENGRFTFIDMYHLT